MIILVENSGYMSLSGLHVHIGSQIFDPRAYDALVERMMKFIKKLKTKHMIEIENLNPGGATTGSINLRWSLLKTEGPVS